MLDKWYPSALRVSPKGTHGTYDFMKTRFASDATFHYAEFGIYKGDTADNVCKLFPNAVLHLFDFQENVDAAAKKLGRYPNRIYYYGNTWKHLDSYNWSLMKLIEKRKGRPCFDYCFLDGAHTVAVDALNFFLADRLLNVGGFMDFDDYVWRLRGSSLDPSVVPVIAEQYTDEQIDARQVKMIVDELVKRDQRYAMVLENKVFQKIGA